VCVVGWCSVWYSSIQCVIGVVYNVWCDVVYDVVYGV